MAESMATKDEESVVIALIVADIHVIRIMDKVKLTLACILDIFHCPVLVKKKVFWKLACFHHQLKA
jgi:hypothetical protein